jgi:hypothetical protein
MEQAALPFVHCCCPHCCSLLPPSPNSSPCLQSLTSPQKPRMGDGDDMAAVINDGLELYARELQQINTSRRPSASQPVAAGSGGGSAAGSLNAPHARPPRAPGVHTPGAGKKSNFYPSSLPKGHSNSRSRPFGQSPPSVAVGEQ